MAAWWSSTRRSTSMAAGRYGKNITNRDQLGFHEEKSEFLETFSALKLHRNLIPSPAHAGLFCWRGQEMVFLQRVQAVAWPPFLRRCARLFFRAAWREFFIARSSAPRLPSKEHRVGDPVVRRVPWLKSDQVAWSSRETVNPDSGSVRNDDGCQLGRFMLLLPVS